jgi:hypothetical protein
MQLDCPATVVTDPTTGALLCQDGTGASVAWVVQPSFDVSSLDASTLTAYFTWGWFIVALGWITGKGVSMAVQFLKNVV